MTEEQTQESREAVAKCLETLAQDIRTGAIEVTDVEQSMPYRRYWAKERWEYFRLLDTRMAMTYHHVGQRKAEQERLEKYLVDNREAQPYGDGGPLGKAVQVESFQSIDKEKPKTIADWQKLSSTEWPLDPGDELLVYLNGEIQGMVIEADVEQGYLIKRTWDGCKVTMKGTIRITFNKQEVVRAEAGDRTKG